MAHFRGTLKGNRGAASRLGTKDSGMRVEAQSWQGKVVALLEYDEKTGKNMVQVSLQQHHGNGTNLLLYEGAVDGSEVTE